MNSDWVDRKETERIKDMLVRFLKRYQGYDYSIQERVPHVNSYNKMTLRKVLYNSTLHVLYRIMIKTNMLMC